MMTRILNSQRLQRYALQLSFLLSHVKKGIGSTIKSLSLEVPRRTSPRKGHPLLLRTTEAPRSKKESLDESLSQDNEKESDLNDSFSECTTEGTCAPPIETIGE